MPGWLKDPLPWLYLVNCFASVIAVTALKKAFLCSNVQQSLAAETLPQTLLGELTAFFSLLSSFIIKGKRLNKEKSGKKRKKQEKKKGSSPTRCSVSPLDYEGRASPSRRFELRVT